MSSIKLNVQKYLNNEYTVFRAYNLYWVVNSSLVEKNSVVLSDLLIVCGVDKISINNVLKIAKEKVRNQSVKYEPFITVKMG